MKNLGKIAGMVLVICMVCNLSLSAQPGMRGMKSDSAGMNMMRMEQRQMHMMNQNFDSSRMAKDMHPMHMGNMNRFMCPMCCPAAGNMACNMRQQAMNMRHMGHGMHGMSPGMGRNSIGKKQPGTGNRQAAPGIRVMENIPNLTDKQKKDIIDLRLKQKDEMQKLQGEMQKKMNELRESHKTKVLNLLTDEQKKWIDENTPKPVKN